MSLRYGLRRLAARLAGRRVSVEDERLLALFRNRTELKKELQALAEERHRLADRLKLQEGATMRVEEQLAALEQYLGRPEEGHKSLAYFQLRAVWRAAAGRVERYAAELARQCKDRERREQLAAFEAARRDRLADADRELVEARVLADQLQAEQRLAEQRLAQLRGFWNHLKRKRLAEAIAARASRIDAALVQVTDLGDRRHELESEPPPMFGGLSLEGRRAINLAVIAHAELLRERLAETGLADLARQTTLRRVYDASYGSREECVGLMQRAARALADIDRLQDDAAELRTRAERLRATVRYRGEGDTVPSPDSLGGAGRVLVEEYWDVYRALLR
jgi:chromosome segregation ATPase